ADSATVRFPVLIRRRLIQCSRPQCHQVDIMWNPAHVLGGITRKTGLAAIKVRARGEEIAVSLGKQLLLTTIGLVLVTLLTSVVAVVWKGAQLHAEQDALRLAQSVAQIRDGAAQDKAVDSIAQLAGISAVRVLDPSLGPFLVDRNAPSD